MVLDITQRHAVGIERDDHAIKPVQAPLTLGHQHRRERAVPVSRDRQFHVTDLGRDGLGGHTVAGVLMQRRFHSAALVADVLGQLRLHTTLQRSLEHPADQALLAREGLTGIDLHEDLIQRARNLELIGDLLLPPAPLLTIQIRLRHNHSLSSFETRPPRLHKPSDTPLGSILRKAIKIALTYGRPCLPNPVRSWVDKIYGLVDLIKDTTELGIATFLTQNGIPADVAIEIARWIVTFA